MFAMQLKSNGEVELSGVLVPKEEVDAAFRTWHRGESLNDRQQELINLAGFDCLARAFRPA